MGKFVDRARQAVAGAKEVIAKIDVKKDKVIIELYEKITKLEELVGKLSKALEKLQPKEDKKADKKSGKQEADKKEDKKAE